MPARIPQRNVHENEIPEEVIQRRYHTEEWEEERRHSAVVRMSHAVGEAPAATFCSVCV